MERSEVMKTDASAGFDSSDFSDKKYFNPVEKITAKQVRALYASAEADPILFWEKLALEFVTWTKDWDEVQKGDFTSEAVQWFSGGELNVSYNCLDRHLLSGKKNKAALIWQGESNEDVRVYTYQMLHSEVCRFANILKKKGVSRGDCVTLYLPMIPELVVAMLACSRIGAIHCVVFAGFSSVSLLSRIKDCNSKLLVTADGVKRGGRVIPLKSNADEALAECGHRLSCIVVKHTGRDIAMKPLIDSWYHDELYGPDITSTCDAVGVKSNDTLFVLYTSGSTGKPKKIEHRAGGYLVYAMYTSRLVFDIGEEDISWCTADIGWITGHSYIVYGPLGLGATTLMYEGVPLYPGPDRFWQIVEKYRVTSFYTSPTVIRALMRFGEEPVEKHDLSSLRILGSVGEPINAEAWKWYRKCVGKNTIPVVDTWWQTETGGIMISPLPGTAKNKPGCAGLPLPGIDVVVVDEMGVEVGAGQDGRLVVLKPWPGMHRGISGENISFLENCSSGVLGGYDTGDGAKCDEDGCFWILGRLDDVINVSGHRLGTAEIESALLTHESVAEAAVVGMPHSLKGQAVYAYVTVNGRSQKTKELLEELRRHVREVIGPIATPHCIQYAIGLPKTRSGKIMRRVLKQIASDDTEDFGDVSTLADPSVIADLLEGKKQRL